MIKRLIICFFICDVVLVIAALNVSNLVIHIWGIPEETMVAFRFNFYGYTGAFGILWALSGRSPLELFNDSKMERSSG